MEKEKGKLVVCPNCGKVFFTDKEEMELDKCPNCGSYVVIC